MRQAKGGNRVMEVKARANTKPQKWGNACHNKGAKRPVQKLCSHMPATCVILVFLVATIKKKIGEINFNNKFY